GDLVHRRAPHTLALEERGDPLGLEPDALGLGAEGVGERADRHPGRRLAGPELGRRAGRPRLELDVVLGARCPLAERPVALADGAVALRLERLAAVGTEPRSRGVAMPAARAEAGAFLSRQLHGHPPVMGPAYAVPARGDSRPPAGRYRD